MNLGYFLVKTNALGLLRIWSDYLYTIIIMSEEIKIAVAGTGYVGLSIATLLAQHHPVTAVDVIPEKVETLNRKQSPIQDEYIENT